jgi:hypothetical protein
MIRLRAAFALAVLALLAACHGREARLPTRANFTAAVTDYLAQRGHLCLAKYDWPIVVPAADARAGDGDARQMRMLESLGLVAAADVPAGRRYELTDEGRKYYLHVPVVVATATQRITHAGDFCVGRLSLDRVFGWEAPQRLGDRTVSSVLFSYRVDPAPWMGTPDARRAFPLAVRAIDNAGTLQLRLGVHLTPDGWVADELSP